MGAHHIGFWIEDFDAVKTKAEARGGKYWMGDPQTSYEVKFHDADGQIFDISLSGWPGTKRDVAGKPARKTAKTKAKTAKATA